MIRALTLTLGLILVSTTVGAQALPVGSVKTRSGSAMVITNGSAVKAVPGTPVYEGSTLRTEANSSLGVTFNDETLMSFGPNTTLVVEAYLYAPTEGRLKLSGRLAKGSLNYVSGVIAKLKPDAVSIATPNGTIGVRGTQFLVRVEE